MKKALVLALVCAFGLGAATFAGPISGKWDTDVCFSFSDTVQTLSVSLFSSLLTIDYTVSGFTLGMGMYVGLPGLTNVYFDVAGQLGAFKLYSFLDFNPRFPMTTNPATMYYDPQFISWDNYLDVNIAGVELYGLFVVDNYIVANATQTPAMAIGAGFAVGAIGEVGDVKIGLEIDFNISSRLYYMFNYGWDWLIGKSIYTSSLTCGAVKSGYITTVQSGCGVAWNEFKIMGEFPFACFDLITTLDFTCAKGFAFAEFEIDNIGITDWLQLGYIDITFGIDSKVFAYEFYLILGDTACFTPIISLDSKDGVIDTITLNALLVDYSFNGVAFKAGTLLQPDWFEAWYGTYTHHFDAQGVIKWNTSNSVCTWVHVHDGQTIVYPDEFFGFTVDGDSCCGGLFSGSVFTFFDMDTVSGDSLFDWLLSSVNLSFGIASNMNITLGLTMDVNGLVGTCIGFDFSW